MPSGAAGGKMPHAKSPRFKSLPSSGGPALPICALRIILTVAESRRFARRSAQKSVPGVQELLVRLLPAPVRRYPRSRFRNLGRQRAAAKHPRELAQKLRPHGLNRTLLGGNASARDALPDAGDIVN